MNTKQVIAESISSSESYISKCKATKVYDNLYLAVFPDVMMGVQMGVNGIGFGDNPYSLRTAMNYSKNVTNGHGQHPVVMTHQEYLDKCIEMQVKHIETMKRIEEQVN
jgi:hypothetical protein